MVSAYPTPTKELYSVTGGRRPVEMQNVLFLSGKEISEHSFISAYANKLHHTSVTIISAVQGQVLPSGPAVAPTCSPPLRGLGAGSGLGTASRREVSFLL